MYENNELNKEELMSDESVVSSENKCCEEPSNTEFVSADAPSSQEVGKESAPEEIERLRQEHAEDLADAQSAKTVEDD